MKTEGTDGINVPLSRQELEDVLHGRVLAIPIPSADNPEGHPAVVVFIRLSEQADTLPDHDHEGDDEG